VPVASAILASGGIVHADTADTGELEEVLVTAQKRTEDLQKVPISIQVLSGEKLGQLQVSSFDDYAKFLPSVSFESFGPGQAQLYFRGIASSAGSSPLHAGPDSATGMYLDETPITTIGNTPDLHVYDIQRVEALAGPQGTLYGASSLSGTLRIITNKPDPSQFSAGYDVQANKYTAGAAGGQFEGFVNIPLADNAAIRLVGYFDRDGGYMNNVPASRTYQRPPYLYDVNGNPLSGPGAPTAAPITDTNAAFVKSNANDISTFGGRAALKVDLNDRWSVTPMVVYQHQVSNGSFSFDPKVGDLDYTDFSPDYSKDAWYQAALTVQGKISNYDLVYSGGYFVRNTTVVSDYSEYSIAYDTNGYSRFRDNKGDLLDPTQNQAQIDRYTKTTHELRLSSPATDTVHFTVGGFLQRQTDNIRDEYLINGLGSSAEYDFAVPGQANTLYLSQQERVDRDYALFGDVTWEISDQWKLSGGLREFRAHNTLYGFFGFNNLFTEPNSGYPANGDNFNHGSGTSGCITPIVTNSNTPCVNTNADVTESGETHRVNLTYQATPDAMLYATYSTGFRPGGPNRRAGLAPYQADTLSNYEFGWKTGWFDHRLRWDGAVFYENWKGVQLQVPGPNGINDIWNIGNAKVTGLESDLKWRATDQLDLTVAGTYVDARTTSNFCGEDLNPADKGTAAFGQLLASCPGAVDTANGPSAPSGTQLPVTPSFKGNATARYHWTVGDTQLFAQGALLHQSSATSILDAGSEAALGPTPAFTTVDFSVGAAKDKWTAELYLDNAFDERGELGRYGQCAAGAYSVPPYYCYANARVYPTSPRIIGIKFGNRF
jgi:outer membrane receptor protein involved in Fe transport